MIKSYVILMNNIISHCKLSLFYCPEYLRPTLLSEIGHEEVVLSFDPNVIIRYTILQ